jgi:hypothetical protein
LLISRFGYDLGSLFLFFELDRDQRRSELCSASCQLGSRLGIRIIIQRGSHRLCISMHSHLITTFTKESPYQRRTMNNDRPSFAIDGKSLTPQSGKCHAKTFSIGNTASSGSTAASDFRFFQSPMVVPKRSSSGKGVATATLPAKRKPRTAWTTQVRGGNAPTRQ